MAKHFRTRGLNRSGVAALGRNPDAAFRAGAVFRAARIFQTARRD